MNAAGLTTVLAGVVARLNAKDYRKIVDAGSVPQDEFDGTVGNLNKVLATLKKTPHHTIEAMVAKYDPDLTAHLDSFNKKSGPDPLCAFRDAQSMAGFISTVLAKSGLRE